MNAVAATAMLRIRSDRANPDLLLGAVDLTALKDALSVRVGQSPKNVAAVIALTDSSTQVRSMFARRCKTTLSLRSLIV